LVADYTHLLKAHLFTKAVHVTTALGAMCKLSYLLIYTESFPRVTWADMAAMVSISKVFT